MTPSARRSVRSWAPRALFRRSRSSSPRPPRSRSRRRWLASVVVLLLPSLLTVACDDSTGPEPPESRVVGVVLNSVDLSLTLFDAEDPGASSPTTVGLAADGSPVSLAVRGGVAVVPLGTVPAVAVVDLVDGTLARTVPLPEGSGATGVAFVNDSVALVGNPALNTVSPVNVRSGEAADPIEVGLYPQGVIEAASGPVVVNSELGADFEPVGPGTLTFLDAETLGLRGSVTLSGPNPGGAVVGPGGRLHVVLSGTFGAGNGSLSVVDPVGLEEEAHHPGFGEFPFSAAFGPGGRLYVASFGYGLAVWDPATEAFVRSPDDPVTPEGVPSVAAVAVDPEGRLYTLRPDCQGPSAALRLAADFSVEETIPVGTCPIAIAFTTVEG